MVDSLRIELSYRALQARAEITKLAHCPLNISELSCRRVLVPRCLLKKPVEGIEPPSFLESYGVATPFREAAAPR